MIPSLETGTAECVSATRLRLRIRLRGMCLRNLTSLRNSSSRNVSSQFVFATQFVFASEFVFAECVFAIRLCLRVQIAHAHSGYNGNASGEVIEDIFGHV